MAGNNPLDILRDSNAFSALREEARDRLDKASKQSSFTTQDVIVNLDMSAYGKGRGASPWTSLSDTFRGKNWIGGIPNLPKNDDFVGLNFITRPELNLSYDNIGTNRILTPLNTSDPLTAQYAVKMYLDSLGTVKRGYASPLVDAASAFIPLLDNTIIEASGWPDLMLDETISDEGKYKEQYGRLKGVTNRLSNWSLNMSHINPKGSPINLFYSSYIAYVEALHQGRLFPYDENVVKNRYDYHMRYYRLILDPFKDTVVMFGCNGYMYPRTDPIGEVLNYATDKPGNDGYDTISVQWSCFGAYYNDPRVLYEFNRSVIKANPLMASGSRELNYQRVPPALLQYFNSEGYPFIDLKTNKFQVWVKPSVWRKTLARVGINPSDINVDSGLDVEVLGRALTGGNVNG